MAKAIRRLRRNGRSSRVSNVLEIPCINVVAAEEVAQSASTAPTIVSTSPL